MIGRAREEGFTLVEVVAAMVVLSIAAGFAAPLMLELSRSVSAQREQRERVWSADHALERVTGLLRAAPESAPEGSGVVDATAGSFELHYGTGVRLEGGTLMLTNASGEWPIVEGVGSFEISLHGPDGVVDMTDAPLEAWSASVTLDLGDGALATRVSLARPLPGGDSDLFAAYAFGATSWTRPVPNEPSADYTKVVQYGSNFLYHPSRGYGYTDIDGIDDSVNNRGVYTGDDEIYDQFIGAKWQVGNDIVFRADVPKGVYRVVLAGGDASYAHTTRMMIRDGADATSEQILIDDVPHASGEFFRVGFDDRAAPTPDGEGSQPVFVHDATSPYIVATEGHIELRQIDAGSNGGTICLLEIWRVEDPFINFDEHTVEPFSASDGAGGRGSGHEVFDGGYSLRLTGNAWKSIEFDHHVTENTVVEFEYAGTLEPGAAGVQLAAGSSPTPGRAAQVWGTEDWAAIAPPAVAAYDGSGGHAVYSLRLRDLNPSFPLGEIESLVFFQDDDEGPAGESVFRNVRVYEEE